MTVELALTQWSFANRTYAYDVKEQKVLPHLEEKCVPLQVTPTNADSWFVYQSYTRLLSLLHVCAKLFSSKLTSRDVNA